MNEIPCGVIRAARSGELSSAINRHRLLTKMGVTADLHVRDGMGHEFFGNVLPKISGLIRGRIPGATMKPSTWRTVLRKCDVCLSGRSASRISFVVLMDFIIATPYRSKQNEFHASSSWRPQHRHSETKTMMETKIETF